MRIRGQDGQTAAEFVGIGFVVAVVIAVLFSFDPSLKQLLTAPVDRQVCEILDARDDCSHLPWSIADSGGDGAAGGGAGGHGDGAGAAGDGGQSGAGARGSGVAVPPTVVCDVTTFGQAVGASVTVLVVSGEGELGYTKKERTDGTYEVTLIGSGGLGLELLAGASAESGDTALGGSGTLGVGADGKVQTTYTFGNEADADAFVQRAKDSASGTLSGSLRAFTGVTSLNAFNAAIGTLQAYHSMQGLDPPEDATRTRVEGEVSGFASGSVGMAVVSIGGTLEAGRALGAEFDHAAGTTTVFVQVDREAAVTAGFLPAVGGNVGSRDDLVLAMKVRTSDLRPLELALATTTQLSGNVDVPAITAAMAFASDDPDPGLLRALGVATGLLTHRDSVSVQSKATLDLTHEADLGLAAGLLDGLASADPTLIAAAGRDVGRHVADRTALSFELTTGADDTLGFDVRAGAGAGGGFGAQSESSSARFVAAVDRPAGGSFAIRNCGTGPG